MPKTKSIKITTKKGGTKKTRLPLDSESGVWGSNLTNFTLPNGVNYNPESIKISTFNKMRNDYQINACLNVLTFTLQKIDWYIDGGTSKVNKHVEESIRNIWNQLIRGLSKAFYAGYSPMVKVFTIRDGLVTYKRIRDLNPATCKVKLDSDQIFDGFIQYQGQTEQQIITPDICLWYTNEMENGNYYGRSRLKAAYNPWYYSEIVHLFTNRYYERFAEPIIKGQAPNEIIEDANGTKNNAMDIVQAAITSLKSHSSMTLPSEFDENGNQLYDVKILESQMRGIDFDVYMKRLDMEKARAIFVPDLLLGTGNTGSYELGKEHKATFLNGLMGIFDDMVDVINKFMIEPIVKVNFGERTTVPKFKYLPISRVSDDLLVNIVTSLINGKMARPSMKELSDKIGIPMEIAEIQTNEPTNTEKTRSTSNTSSDGKKAEAKTKNDLRKEIMHLQVTRLENGIRKAVDDNTSLHKQYEAMEKIKVGYWGRVEDRLGEDVKNELYQKAGKAVKKACNVFMQKSNIDDVVIAAKEVFLEGEQMANTSDFIDPDNYMPNQIKAMDIVYRNLYRDTFKESYKNNKDIYISEKNAEDAVSTAINENFKEPLGG